MESIILGCPNCSGMGLYRVDRTTHLSCALPFLLENHCLENYPALLAPLVPLWDCFCGVEGGIPALLHEWVALLLPHSCRGSGYFNFCSRWYFKLKKQTCIYIWFAMCACFFWLLTQSYFLLLLKSLTNWSKKEKRPKLISEKTIRYYKYPQPSFMALYFSAGIYSF